MGIIASAPHIFYWNTKNKESGDHTIKAVYTSSENISIGDEELIELLPVTATCQEEVIDIDGNSYSVIQVDNQCWMQENLKVTRFPDGEELLNGIDSIIGGLANELPGWYFAYDRDSSLINNYGYLYNWVTVMKGNRGADETTGPIQGICPEGWHVPDVYEWRALIDFVGGVEIASIKLKDTSDVYWINNSPATDNASGFTAFPGGCRVSDGSFIELRTGAYFWSATETIQNHAYHILLNNSDPKAFVLGYQDSKRFGYSVMCIKD